MIFLRNVQALLALALLFSNNVHAQSATELKLLIENRDAKALASATAFNKANPKLADSWIYLARAQMQAGKSEAAVKSAEKAVQLAPTNSQAQFWLGNAYGMHIGSVGMLGKMSLAPKLRDAFEATVRLDPENLDARNGLLLFYLQAPSMMGGGKDKALLQVKEISKRDAALGHLAQAQVFLVDKNNEAALKSFEAAYALKPNDASIRMALGVGYQQAKRWNDAFKHFRAWVAQDAKAQAALYQIGRTSYLSQQLLDEGITALKKYLTLTHSSSDPQNKHAYLRLGQLYALQAKKPEAKAAFQNALKLDASFKEAKAELGKL